LGNLPVVLPPIDEQREIARFVDEELGKLEDVLQRVDQSIFLLSEYRSSLITAAVTGQIAP
jgi:restriction endonuclease S subunit